MTTFPALEAFNTDVDINIRDGYNRWRVYMYLQRHTLDFQQVRHVKANELAKTLRMRPATVIEALNALVQGGYLVEHPRTWRGIRQFTLAYTAPSRTQPSV